YFFFGKGFAYLGLFPLYVGEIVLLCNLLILFFLSIEKNWVTNFYVRTLSIFILFCVLNFAPNLAVYGVDSLRDSSIWIYSLFFFNKISKYYVVWIAVAFLTKLNTIVPFVPGTDVPIISVKKGDMGVILAVIGSFQFLMSPQRGFNRTHWICWLLGFLYVGSG